MVAGSGPPGLAAGVPTGGCCDALLITAPVAAPIGSANRPSSSTSSQRRGLTLWRNWNSLPLSWLCHRSNRALPMLRASSGSCGLNCGDRLVSSSLSGATPASTRSLSTAAIPCRTAAGSRPRSSNWRQASLRARGSAVARPRASSSSSCSGTAPSSSQTAIASTGAGSSDS